jgi:hypothetical protein
MFHSEYKTTAFFCNAQATEFSISSHEAEARSITFRSCCENDGHKIMPEKMTRA